MNPVGVWVLQYAPHNYDFDNFIKTQGLCDFWELTRSKTSMNVGDRAYIVQLSGKQAAGIVAIGQLVSRIYTPTEGGRRVDVLFESLVDPMLTREEMRHESILQDNYGLCHGIPGADFEIHSLEEIHQLEELTTPRLRPLSSPSSSALDLSQDERTRANVLVVRRQGQAEFRRDLLLAYGSRCAVTGCDAIAVLEAAHISRFLGTHTNLVTNGLLLRADIHTLFDQGLLAIDTASMTLLLAPQLLATTYAELAGQHLRLPAEVRHHPNKEALDLHRRSTDWAN